MLLGVVAAATAPVAPWAATLACRLADPFLVGRSRSPAGPPAFPAGRSPCRDRLAPPRPWSSSSRWRRRRDGGGQTCLAPPSCRSRSRGRAGEDEMITADELRRVVLSLPEAEERETRGHPTFRVRDRMFAALSDDGRQASV